MAQRVTLTVSSPPEITKANTIPLADQIGYTRYSYDLDSAQLSITTYHDTARRVRVVFKSDDPKHFTSLPCRQTNSLLAGVKDKALRYHRKVLARAAQGETTTLTINKLKILNDFVSQLDALQGRERSIGAGFYGAQERFRREVLDLISFTRLQNRLLCSSFDVDDGALNQALYDALLFAERYQFPRHRAIDATDQLNFAIADTSDRLHNPVLSEIFSAYSLDRNTIQGLNNYFSNGTQVPRLDAERVKSILAKNLPRLDTDKINFILVAINSREREIMATHQFPELTNPILKSIFANYIDSSKPDKRLDANSIQLINNYFSSSKTVPPYSAAGIEHLLRRLTPQLNWYYDRWPLERAIKEEYQQIETAHVFTAQPPQQTLIYDTALQTDESMPAIDDVLRVIANNTGLAPVRSNPKTANRYSRIRDWFISLFSCKKKPPSAFSIKPDKGVFETVGYSDARRTSITVVGTLDVASEAGSIEDEDVGSNTSTLPTTADLLNLAHSSRYQLSWLGRIGIQVRILASKIIPALKQVFYNIANWVSDLVKHYYTDIESGHLSNLDLHYLLQSQNIYLTAAEIAATNHGLSLLPTTLGAVGKEDALASAIYSCLPSRLTQQSKISVDIIKTKTTRHSFLKTTTVVTSVASDLRAKQTQLEEKQAAFEQTKQVIQETLQQNGFIRPGESIDEFLQQQLGTAQHQGYQQATAAKLFHPKHPAQSHRYTNPIARGWRIFKAIGNTFRHHMETRPITGTVAFTGYVFGVMAVTSPDKLTQLFHTAHIDWASRGIGPTQQFGTYLGHGMSAEAVGAGLGIWQLIHLGSDLDTFLAQAYEAIKDDPVGTAFITSLALAIGYSACQAWPALDNELGRLKIYGQLFVGAKFGIGIYDFLQHPGEDYISSVIKFILYVPYLITVKWFLTTLHEMIRYGEVQTPLYKLGQRIYQAGKQLLACTLAGVLAVIDFCFDEVPSTVHIFYSGITKFTVNLAGTLLPSFLLAKPLAYLFYGIDYCCGRVKHAVLATTRILGIMLQNAFFARQQPTAPDMPHEFFSGMQHTPYRNAYYEIAAMLGKPNPATEAVLVEKTHAQATAGSHGQHGTTAPFQQQQGRRLNTEEQTRLQFLARTGKGGQTFNGDPFSSRSKVK